jgi:glycosyltransferase involved in cell wall biosynthesis
VNRFFAGFSLSPVSLRNQCEPVSVMNLVGAAPADGLVEGPLVSILMTAFNVGQRVSFAIESLLAQSWKNLEVVVVDDASESSCAPLVSALARRDSRVRFIQLHQNVGTFVAKTIALQAARGEFVTTQDADDWSHPERIARQMRPLLEDSSLVATTSRWVRLSDAGEFYARSVYPMMRFNPSSVLFRRAHVEQGAGFWDAARMGADSEFHTRLKLVFGRKAVKRLDLPLSFGAHRADSLMVDPETGFGLDGMRPAPDLTAYHEAYVRWHIAELRAGRKPFMPPMDAPERPFAVPASLQVDPAAIRAVLP